MSDIALVWDETIPAADIALDGADFLADEGLHTSILLSIYLDARAEIGDDLPEGETSRRGWWGDTEEDKIGSRLWLLARSKGTPDILDRAEQYAREALQWLLDDKVASEVIVEAGFVDSKGVVSQNAADSKGYALLVTIVRPMVDQVTFRFGKVWESTT